MLKGLLALSGCFICWCVYGPKRYKKLKLSFNFQLCISLAFCMFLVLSMIMLTESFIGSLAFFLGFIVICVIWAIVVRNKYPIMRFPDSPIQQKAPMHQESLELNKLKTSGTTSAPYKEIESNSINSCCPKCGKEMPGNAAFCPFCGKKCTQKKLQKNNRAKINLSKRTVITIIFITVFAFVLCVGYFILSQKQHSYDLSTKSEGKLSSTPPGSIYAKTTANGKTTISDAIYINNNIYLHSISTSSGDMHTPNDVFYVLSSGVYESNKDKLLFLDSEGKTKEYKVLNRYLLCTDEFYSGDIPKKNRFTSTHVRTFDDGTKQTISFFENGTYTLTQQAIKQSGTYIRKGYDICCISDDEADTNINFIVYEGKLTQSYYEVSPKDTEWIEYKTLIHKRDILCIELTYYEKTRVHFYEREHPISSGR